MPCSTTSHWCGNRTHLSDLHASLGSGSSRTGLCNSPHPDERYRELVDKPVMENGKPKVDPKTKQLVTEEVLAPTVTCSRLRDHDGDCAAYAFSIIEPDTWPNPNPPF